MPAVMIAQVSDTQQASATADRVIGVCTAIENSTEPGGVRGESVGPLVTLSNYFRIVEGKDVGTDAGVVSVLKEPTHGTSVGSGDRLAYTPEAGYDGDDQMTVLVELDGKKYELVYLFHVENRLLDDEDFGRLCPTYIQKIAYSLDQAGLRANLSPVDLMLDFGALEGGAVGKAEGKRITLDDEASDHGWRGLLVWSQ